MIAYPRGPMKSKGFSLIEIMVAVGLILIVIFASLQMQKNMLDSVSFIEDRLLKIEIQKNVLDIISSQKSCKASFAGIAIPSGVVPGSGTTVAVTTPLKFVAMNDTTLFSYTPNTAVNARISLGDINLVNIRDVGGNNQYVVDLSIGIKRKDSIEIRPIEMKGVFVTIDPVSRNIVDCSPATGKVIFLATPVVVGANITADTGWLTFNLPATIPVGVSALIFEVRLVNNWRVGTVEMQYRVNSTGYVYAFGRSFDDDSRGADDGHKILPYDTTKRSFDYLFNEAGDGGTAKVSIIGWIY